MPNRSTDSLFQLVKSLEKSEKRNFKLFVRRNTATEDLKVIQLFDALDKMTDYDEELLKKGQEYQETAVIQYQGTFIQTNTVQPSADKG